jgi:hypothetical protein
MIKTVGDLIDALSVYPCDLPVEVYESDGSTRAVSMFRVTPGYGEGGFDVLLLAHDTLPPRCSGEPERRCLDSNEDGRCDLCGSKVP